MANKNNVLKYALKCQSVTEAFHWYFLLNILYYRINIYSLQDIFGCHITVRHHLPHIASHHRRTGSGAHRRESLCIWVIPDLGIRGISPHRLHGYNPSDHCRHGGKGYNRIRNIYNCSYKWLPHILPGERNFCTIGEIHLCLYHTNRTYQLENILVTHYTRNIFRIITLIIFATESQSEIHGFMFSISTRAVWDEIVHVFGWNTVSWITQIVNSQQISSYLMTSPHSLEPVGSSSRPSQNFNSQYIFVHAPLTHRIVEDITEFSWIHKINHASTLHFPEFSFFHIQSYRKVFLKFYSYTRFVRTVWDSKPTSMPHIHKWTYLIA